MNTVSQFLQSEIKRLSSESHDILLRIVALKWGSIENARHAGELRAVRTPEGAPARRAELKKLHHPETGDERSALWGDKRELKDKIRHYLLAYAFIRGRSYVSQEPTCKAAPSLSWIASILGEAGAETPPKTALESWINPKVEAGASAPVAA